MRRPFARGQPRAPVPPTKDHIQGSQCGTKMEQMTHTTDTAATTERTLIRWLDTKSLMEASFPDKKAALVSCQEKDCVDKHSRKRTAEKVISRTRFFS